MRRSLSKFGAALLALAASTFAPSTHAKTPADANQQTKHNAINTGIRAANEYVRDIVGGVPVMTVGTGGIPPHIYGRYYVKRGTHKRTNKRK